MNPLRERELARRFATIFEPEVVDIISISAANQEGWPDRMLQIETSRVVFAELKVIKVLQNGKYPMHPFRPAQAAFMAKWQRNGGLCFLFLGLLDYSGDFIGYHTLAVERWDTWIKLPKQVLDLRPMTESEVKAWFAKLTES